MINCLVKTDAATTGRTGRATRQQSCQLDGPPYRLIGGSKHLSTGSHNMWMAEAMPGGPMIAVMSGPALPQ